MAKFAYPKIAPSEIEATPSELAPRITSRREALAALAAGAGVALLAPNSLAQPTSVSPRSATPPLAPPSFRRNPRWSVS